MESILRIGHRGAMGYEPENTLRSFRKALELGVDMIELDVMRCRSGEVVVFHDERLERTTNGTGFVARKTLKELKELDAGKGEKIPTLEEALEAIDRKAKVNIELKGSHTLHAVIHIVNRFVQQKGWKHEDFLLSSFMRKSIKKLYRANQKIPRAALLSYRLIGFFRFAKSIKAFSAHISLKLVTPGFVKSAHSQGMKVFVWTVNEPADIERVKLMGVDGIFSDFPDRIGKFAKPKTSSKNSRREKGEGET